MNRTTVTYLITVLLLLMNIQAAMSDVGEIFHNNSGSEVVLTTDSNSHGDDLDDDSHCQHCCHTHASNVFAHASVNYQFVLFETHSYHSIGKSSPAYGPPTPPPNA